MKSQPSLGKVCIYSEDVIQDHFDPRNESSPPALDSLKILGLNPVGIPEEINAFSHETIQHSTVDFVLRILGPSNKIMEISTAFFTGTHQRISAVSKHRFQRNLQ